MAKSPDSPDSKNEKRDLTGILEQLQENQNATESSADNQGPEDSAQSFTEKVDQFESLEELSHEHAGADAPEQLSSLEELTGDVSVFAPSKLAEGEISNAVTGKYDDQPLGTDGDPEFHADTSADPLAGNSFEDSPITGVDPSDFHDPRDPEAPPAEAPHPTPPHEAAMTQTRQYSEKVGNQSAKNVAASFPFSLLIEGKLAPYEKARLLDIISREKMGFREVDLEHQFSENRILLPRISEYAGVLIVQALRSTKARMRLGPSELIFSTQASDNDVLLKDEEDSETLAHPSVSKSTVDSDDLAHPAEALPISLQAFLPSLDEFSVIDTLSASASLRTQAVEAESSVEYQELLENLQRELKYKAYRRGATAILNFQLQLHPLSQSSHYRMQAMGTAVKSISPYDSKENDELGDLGDLGSSLSPLK
jgi:hypothetical protein